MRLPNRVYFVKYGYVFSFNVSSAYDYAARAIRLEDVILGDYGKLLRRRGSGIAGKGWPFNHPLCFNVTDNNEQDWQDILDKLRTMTEMKAGLY